MIRGMMAKYEEAVALTRMTGEGLLGLKFPYYKSEDNSKNPLYKVDTPNSLIKDPEVRREIERDCMVIKTLDGIIYSLSNDTHDKIFLLSQKEKNLKAIETKDQSTTSRRETWRWISWIQKALDDLQKIQDAPSPKTSLQIEQDLARGNLTPYDAAGEAKAALLEIERLISNETREDFSIQEFADNFEKAIEANNNEQIDSLLSSVVPILSPYGIRIEEISSLLNIRDKYSTGKAEGQPTTSNHEDAIGQNPGKTLLQDSELNMFAEAAAEAKLTPTNDGKYIVHKSLPDVLEYFQKHGYTYTPQLIHYWILKRDGSPFALSSVEKYCKDYPTKTNQKAREARDTNH